MSNLEKVIQNALNDESERNGNVRSHEYWEYCSCGICHSSSISATAIKAYIKTILPGKKGYHPDCKKDDCCGKCMDNSVYNQLLSTIEKIIDDM